MISAFAARRRVVLGRIEVAEKSNELVAIPKLLDLLATEGAIVGTDCHRLSTRHRYTMRVDSRLESVGGTYPSSAKWSRCFLRCGVVIGV
jgi:predicted transposase YbfD/YdcC